MAWQWAKSCFASFPRGTQLLICVLVGTAAGMGVVIARISNIHSYLSDAPETCMNCHVMTDAYATWKRGSHGRVAVCNDCHVPHSNPVAKYAFKAMDGTKHSYVFTMRNEPQVMKLSHMARPVVQANCVRCHSDPLYMIRLAAVEERACWSCHNNIHGKVHSLSASPEVLRPGLPSAGLPLKRME
ncbi:cytochrome c nitrite reductase small subunit [Planctomycetota bacterium]